MKVVKRPIFLLDVADCADYLFTEGLVINHICIIKTHTRKG